MPRKALIVGATGLVGSKLLKLLEDDSSYNEIIVVTRKPVLTASGKVTQHCLNFDHLYDHKEKFIADDIFCCLGTTMKNAGSKENFYKVDYSYVVNLATICSENNSTSFNLISATGANKNSVFYYNKVKGAVEEAILSLKFSVINIVRPSLILGERNEARPFEKAFQVFSKYFGFVFSGPFKKYTPVEADLIAKALLKSAKKNKEGVHIIESNQLTQVSQ